MKALPQWEEYSQPWSACIVFDEEDRPTNVRFALDLNRPQEGLLTVDITPGNRKTYELAKDVLKALGKRADATGAANTSHEAWFRACAWIVGERIHDIVVCRAHLVDGGRWRRLIELAAIADARLWLIVHRPSLNRGQKETARDWGIVTMSFPEFRRRWKAARPAGPKHAAPPPEFPKVPDEEFPTFLARSKVLLDPASFARVSDAYWTAHQQTLLWFQQQASASRGEVGDVAIAGFLYELLAPLGGLEERIVCARAAQAAAFLCGWLLRLDVRALAGGYLAAPVSDLDERAIGTLRLYGHPRHAAAALLSLASREPQSELTAMNLGDIEADGSSARIAGRTVAIPDGARGIARAHLAFRLSEGAATGDPLFVSEKRQAGGREGRVFGRITPHGLQGRLSSIATETGLSIIATGTPGREDPKRWLRRQGLGVHRIKTRAPQR